MGDSLSDAWDWFRDNTQAEENLSCWESASAETRIYARC